MMMMMSDAIRVYAEMRTVYLLNRSLERYHFANPLGSQFTALASHSANDFRFFISVC
jgi:hypothetical protein